jgi:hypothetical protein
MFCFPMTCIKLFIGLGSIFTIILSIGLLACNILYYLVTIYATLQKKKVIDSNETNFANNALISLYITAVILLLMGVAGLYGNLLTYCLGSIKKNKALLFVFFIGTIVFLFIFLGGMFLFYLAPHHIFDGTCSASKTQMINNLANLNNFAEITLCSSSCPCDLDTSIYTND